MDEKVAPEGDDTGLHFEVSAGLKRVIGRDLITDDEVAVFELVKNSFDANATVVSLFFEPGRILIIDNGDGMSLDDIKNKWLMVAYSSKRVEETPVDGFRQQISSTKHYAGSKGIGRFSSDRLGSELRMQTKPEGLDKVHIVEVDWELFDENQSAHFDQIPVEYTEAGDFTLPSEVDSISHGTVIEISSTRVVWDRQAILKLKSSLAKLINPFGSETDGFGINIISPIDLSIDCELVEQSAGSDDGPPHNALVNGPVGNFIFSTLREKTTFIEVSIDEGGGHIVSSLTDRGELIYKIREPHGYPDLERSGFSCRLYYLNQSAKQTFARRMGLPSVQFGSVFLFRNGFRVYPIGEDGDDWFGIDRRKQQGYARFLGTRDVIGRVDVSGTEEQFKEASSRNQGLIDTAAARAMRDCFWEFCLKRLERYVVPVTWVDAGEKFSDDLSRLLTDSGRARVAAAVARLVDNPEVEVVEYSRKLINILNERSNQFEESIVSLRAIAVKTNDSELLSNLHRAEKRFEDLKAAEAEALKFAEEERRAKEAAQKQAKAAEAKAKEAEESLEEEKKRNLFLTSLSSLDADIIINMHHQITIYAADLKQQVENCLAAARAGELNGDDLISRMEQVAFLNQKVLSISRLATKANFRLESDKIEADVADFIEQYVLEGAAPFLGAGLRLKVENNANLVKRFSPIEISVVVDNLINNSRKARSSEVVFFMSQVDKKTIQIDVSDNGGGLQSSISEPERVFELGFSRTSGSGLGLYHVRQVLGELGGSISLAKSSMEGTTFSIRITA
ncbi:sensor histidine kinase [Pseudomonas citronellolis]|uniref:sensor histidine kinase n=1 Tax=Pseudomonas citronellolis TaxID=53408 RepID=UPI0018D8869F|nr:sensor histidine kinase [Pseudomonas citronellolis]MBH3432630.1 sensor histidine kinase [Pseudomonas citronellolis]